MVWALLFQAHVWQDVSTWRTIYCLALMEMAYLQWSQSNQSTESECLYKASDRDKLHHLHSGYHN